MKIDEYYCKKFNLNIFVLESYVMAQGPKRLWKLGQDQTTENPNEFLHHATIEQIKAWAEIEKIALLPYDAPKAEQSDGRYITPKSRVNNLKVYIDQAAEIIHKHALAEIESFEHHYGNLKKDQKREFYQSLVHDFTRVYCS